MIKKRKIKSPPSCHVHVIASFKTLLLLLVISLAAATGASKRSFTSNYHHCHHQGYTVPTSLTASSRTAFCSPGLSSKLPTTTKSQNAPICSSFLISYSKNPECNLPHNLNGMTHSTPQSFSSLNSSSSTRTTTSLYMARRKTNLNYKPGDYRKGNFSVGGSSGGIGGNIRKNWRKLTRFNRDKFSIQKVLVYINIVMFALQVRSAILYLPVLNAVLRRSGGLPLDSIDILLNSFWGSSPLVVRGPTPLLPRGTHGRLYALPSIVASSSGPLTMDFVHQVMLSRYQLHRYLSSGFLHGSLIHLVLNMRYLWMLPNWLEYGLGKGLYLSAFLVSIVTGNLAHTFAATASGGKLSTLVLGASGGICGLEGLMFASLRKMGNYDEAGNVFTNMVWLIVFGLMNDSVSNAGHVGGFIGGALVGYLFGPSYGRSYGMRRKFSVSVDPYAKDYRRVMRFGIEPDNQGKVFPLWYLWGAVGLAMLSKPQLREIPGCIVKGFLEPGKLSGVRMSI